MTDYRHLSPFDRDRLHNDAAKRRTNIAWRRRIGTPEDAASVIRSLARGGIGEDGYPVDYPDDLKQS